jgi:hypothetical protein
VDGENGKGSTRFSDFLFIMTDKEMHLLSKLHETDLECNGRSKSARFAVMKIRHDALRFGSGHYSSGTECMQQTCDKALDAQPSLRWRFPQITMSGMKGKLTITSKSGFVVLQHK